MIPSTLFAFVIAVTSLVGVNGGIVQRDGFTFLSPQPTLQASSPPQSGVSAPPPVSSSPVSSAPVSKPPVSSAPVSAPVSSPSVSSAPVSKPPVSSAPVSAPVSSPPVSSAPASKPPVSSAPVSAPVSSPPVSSAPVSKPPVSSAPVSAPVSSPPASSPPATHPASSTPVPPASSPPGTVPPPTQTTKQAPPPASSPPATPPATTSTCPPADGSTTPTSPSGTANCNGVQQWQAAFAYTAGNKVIFNNQLYTALQWTYNNAPPAHADQWSANGVCSQPIKNQANCKGIAAWQQSVAYTSGNEVTFNGHLWSAVQWTQSNSPGDTSGTWQDIGACM